MTWPPFCTLLGYASAMLGNRSTGLSISHSSLPRQTALVLLFALYPGWSAAQQMLLFDNFDGPALDTSTWGVADWNIGDRTQFGNQPEFGSTDGDTFIRLPLDTYNPNLPGQRVLGTEIYSLRNFNNEGGVEYLARARLRTDQPGLVAAFFTYNQVRQKGRWLADEIDFEILSKQAFSRVLVTSWDDWGAAGSDYEDGVHHLGAFLDLPAFDWRSWNTYAMHWYPDRVEWYVNEVLVRTHDSPVPDLEQPVRASLWAGGTTWPDAFDASLAPVASPALNRTFEWEIDYIMVSRLDGGGGAEQPPAAPAGLAASVNAGQVLLGWTDQATDESTYTVYRAWKPKGKSAPDFKAVAQLGANSESWTDKPPAGAHLYRVTASNAAGESAPSNTVSATVGSSPAPLQHGSMSTGVKAHRPVP